VVYRTGEDDEGIHPFAGGETLSTAAHHASALTLSAGLGGRGERRDVSLSGAEYDPERPLQDLIAGIGTKFNLFDAEKEPSPRVVGLPFFFSYSVLRSPVSYIQSNPVPFDPPIVDSTAGLDQILSAQHVTATTRRVRSPYSEQSTSSSSEPDTPDPTSSKPKLSDALSHLTFSPKRPRSPALLPRSEALVHVRGPILRDDRKLTRITASSQSHRVTARPSLRVPPVDAGEGERPHVRARSICERKLPTRTHFIRLHLPLPTRTSQDWRRDLRVR
jgi:hypothetical protein